MPIYRNPLIEALEYNRRRNLKQASVVANGINKVVGNNVRNFKRKVNKVESKVKVPFRTPRVSYSNNPLKYEDNNDLQDAINTAKSNHKSMFLNSILNENLNRINYSTLNKAKRYSPITYTEKDFNNAYLHTLDSIVDANMKKVPEKDRSKPHLIHGSYYDKHYTEMPEGEMRNIKTPIDEIKHTLGSFPVNHYTPYGYEVKDIYDFSQKSFPKQPGLNYNTIRFLAPYISARNTDPDFNKIHTFIRRYK